MILLITTITLLIPKILYADQNSNDLGGTMSFLLFPLLFILMYFLLIRPQTKKANEHKQLISNLKINDEIVTQGGLLGKVKKITDKFVIISLNLNTDIIIKKEAITNSLPKGTMKQIK